jgi:hypothetical protein
MDKFDQEELKAALESGNIPVSDDEIRQLGGTLRALTRQYQARKVARAQELNGQLARLEAVKNFFADLMDTEPLLFAFESESAHLIKRLSGAVQHGIVFLKNEKELRKVRGDDPETALFMDLRDLYVGLSGKTGISDHGPLHRFATACAKLIDQNIVLPQPQSLRKALKRRATAPPYFRQLQKRQDGVHSVTAQPAPSQSARGDCADPLRLSVR